MKTIIAGGRDITSMEEVEAAIRECGWEITEVVCGGARGVDALGKEWGEARGIYVKPFPADWKRHGKSAGPIRNREMASYGDALILVWDGKSRGSANMKKQATEMGLRIHERIVR